jgi:thioredoxin reductase (NADPH)
MSDRRGAASGTGSTMADGRPEPDPAAETPDLYGAYPRLSEGQIAAIAAHGTQRAVRPGDVLFREGDAGPDFFVIQAGLVKVVEGFGTPDERRISVHGPGRFLGELSVLTGEAVPITAVALEPGEIVAVPAARLREVVTRDPELGDLILRAYLIRRSILLGLGAGLRILGSRHSADSRRLRDFCARNRLPHQWLDAEQDGQAERLVQQLGLAPADMPVVLLYGRQVLRNPSNAELASALGLPAHGREGTADVVVVGAGPAGLAASVYAASEGLSTLTLEAIATGGQAGTSSLIENYLGFPSGISGAALAERAAIQAMKFGATITVPAEATALAEGHPDYRIALDGAEPVHARAVIIATGARYRKLDVPGMDRLEQASVYYAASQSEALLCQGDPVAVVGGGNSAGQASLFLARHAATVCLLARESDLGENMSRYLTDRIQRTDRIDVSLNTEVRELLGDQVLEALVVEDNRAGARRQIPARALFVFVGVAPHTGWLKGQVALDEHGFIQTGAGLPRQAPGYGGSADGQPLPLETSRPGVFAAGDVRSGSVKRVASAVGEGAMAVRMLYERQGAWAAATAPATAPAPK